MIPPAHHSFDLTGRVAIVTGAGRNIGRGIALTVASAGADVVVADLDGPAAAETAALIERRGGRAIGIAVDLTDPDDVVRLFRESEAALGLPDVLINNAFTRTGESNWGPFLSVEYPQWRLFLDENLSMLFLTSQRFARGLVHAGRTGTIVNIGSNGSDRVHRNHIPYDSMKGALDTFTRAIAVELAPWGIRANAVRPGSMDLRGLPAAGRDDSGYAQVPMGRGADPADVGRAVVYLASSASDYVTGQLLTVDGGLLVQGRPPTMEGVAVATPDTVSVLDPDTWPGTADA